MHQQNGTNKNKMATNQHYPSTNDLKNNKKSKNGTKKSTNDLKNGTKNKINKVFVVIYYIFEMIQLKKWSQVNGANQLACFWDQ